jgi:hypothetical protein
MYLCCLSQAREPEWGCTLVIIYECQPFTVGAFHRLIARESDVLQGLNAVMNEEWRSRVPKTLHDCRGTPGSVIVYHYYFERHDVLSCQIIKQDGQPIKAPVRGYTNAYVHQVRREDRSTICADSHGPKTTAYGCDSQPT